MSEKETNNEEEEEEEAAAMKSRREKIERRIAQAHSTQLELISSLQTQVPSLIPSLSLSLQISSLFNLNRPFDPLPSFDPLPPKPKRPRPIPHPSSTTTTLPSLNKPTSFIVSPDSDSVVGVDVGNPFLVVRSMVAVCLMERVPFSPIDSSTLLRKLENDLTLTHPEKSALRSVDSGAVETALRSMSDDNGCVDLEEFQVSGKSTVMVMGIDRTRLLKELPESKQMESGGGNGNKGAVAVGQFPRPDMWMGPPPPPGPRMMMMMVGGRGNMMPRPPPPIMAVVGGQSVVGSVKPRTEEEDLKEVEDLLNKKSFLDQQKSKTGEELLDLIRRPTAKAIAVAAKFKSKGGSQVKEYCTALTKEDCRRQTGSYIACEKVHFRRIIALHTDMNLGDCSFLDTCRHMKTCKYVHYELDNSQDVTPMMMATALGPPRSLKPQRAEYCSEVELGEPQWINCDIRNFRMDILGQFGVIMADPPWDIHMELPYGTMADDEMRTLNVPALQTDGLIFLWVTGRAMELGRECLEHWGYKRCEEIIWVKTNQLQRIIRTGRTGHWLNHSKEHCLVGIKGDPLVNRNIDTDVLVAEVRETSRKPDEMYPLLERISPRTRKLELFARMHNTQAGWMSMGNQLSGVRLVDEGLRARFKAAYPEVEVQPASPPRASTMEAEFTNNDNNNIAQTKSPFAPVESKTTLTEQKPMNLDIEMTS